MGINRIRWEIEPTCNLNCKHCFVGKDSLTYPKRIDLNTGLNILDNLHKSGVKELVFTTREPLLNPYVCQYIARCSKLGIRTGLITNGTCLTNERLASNLIESGLWSIAISLEGPNADTNDSIRGEKSFERVIAGIDVFQRQMFKTGRVLPVSLQMSLNAYNSGVCESLPTLINELPFDYLSIGALSNTGNAKLNQEIILNDDQYFDLFSVIAREYKKIKHPNFVLMFKALMPWEAVLIRQLTGYDIYPVTPYCSVLNGAYSMLPDGNIVTCISLFDEKNSERVYGEEAELNNKLESAFYESVQKIKRLNELIKKDYCTDCYFSDRCLLCPAAANDRGMRLAAIQRCIKAKKRFEELIELQYKKGCYLKLDRAQVLFTYREMIFQKNYADSIRKEFRFNVENESDYFIKELIHDSIFRKGSFQGENNIVKSLIIEGIVSLQGGRGYE